MGDRFLQRLQSHQVGELSGILSRGEVVLLDLTFLLESNEHSFCGAPLILGPHGEDYTVVYGVARGMLRLRNTVGIKRGIVILGCEATAVSTEATINCTLRFLTRLGAPFVYEPKARAGALCKGLAPPARWAVTQNKTLFQLVNNDFRIIAPGVGFEVVSVESLRVTLGIRPAQIPSFLALTEGGNQAPFTKRQAMRLLEVHEDLETVLRDISTVSSCQMRHQLAANEKLLLRRLSDTKLDGEGCLRTLPATSALTFIKDDENSAAILREYGFWSLERLLPQPLITAVPASARVKPEVAYRAIRNEAGIRELEVLLSKADVCAVDTEASDKDPRSATLFGVAFSVKSAEAFYVPLNTADLQGTSPEVMKAHLARILVGRTKFIGHNLKFDCVILRRNGIMIRHAFFDTMLAAYECFGDWEFFNLSAVVKKLLGKDITRYRDLVGKGETLLDVPFNELLEHACADADMTLRLYHRMWKELESRRLLEQFSSETMALLSALAARECSGVRLNIRAVHRRREAHGLKAEAMRRAVIAQVGKEFDLDSPTETASALRKINPFGEQVGRRLTITQLEQLASAHSLPRMIVKYGRLQKLVRQLDAITGAARDGRVFPIFSQIRWAHGGLSSTHPNICEPDGPLEAAAVIDKTIRDRINDPNRSLDILRRVTGDEVLKRGGPRLLDRPPVGQHAAGPDVDQKDLLLSVAVGLSDAALSRRFLIDRLTVATIRQTLEAKYVTMFKWLNTYRTDAMTKGFAYHDGKRKYLSGLKSSDLDKRQKALTSAVRWLIQY